MEARLSALRACHALLPRKIPSTRSCWRLRLSQPRAIVRLEGLSKLKKEIQWSHRESNPRRHVSTWRSIFSGMSPCNLVSVCKFLRNVVDIYQTTWRHKLKYHKLSTYVIYTVQCVADTYPRYTGCCVSSWIWRSWGPVAVHWSTRMHYRISHVLKHTQPHARADSSCEWHYCERPGYLNASKWRQESALRVCSTVFIKAMSTLWSNLNPGGHGNYRSVEFFL
jgi:hypothetical protein